MKFLNKLAMIVGHIIIFAYILGILGILNFRLDIIAK
jgi:hypothetical protein